jgi:enamine deaminase RidA (YjgF/YER057c/UK114 family)
MEPNLEPQGAERRRIVRQKSFLRGMIYFNHRRSVLDCLIRDISPYGARLVFSLAVATPDMLELCIPQKDRTLRTHVMWRHGREIGVAFAQIMELDQPGDLAERVTRLEVEVAALKKMFKKLKPDLPDFDAA